MKSNCLAVLLLAIPLVAQDDRVFKIDGTVIDGVRVTAFDIRDVRFTKDGKPQTLRGDHVARVDLDRFNDVFRLGLRDADLMITKAREQLAEGETLLTQLALVRASAMFFDTGRPQEASAALDELEKAVPDAGVLPEIYRQKFEFYMGQGPSGAKSAGTVAKKYLAEAQGNAWPAGYAVEAAFFDAMAQRSAGGSPQDFQTALASVISSAHSESAVMVSNRANIQLANSKLEMKDTEAARKIFEDLASKAGVDSSSRAGAYLGLGLLAMSEAGTREEVYKQALLWFLRVHLETTDAWPSLRAEALYNAVQAAGKWRGPEHQYIMARCRGVLKSDFPKSEWTERALSGR